MKGWVCSTAYSEELGHTDVKVYHTKEALMSAESCCTSEERGRWGQPYWCEPVEIEIYTVRKPHERPCQICPDDPEPFI